MSNVRFRLRWQPRENRGEGAGEAEQLPFLKIYFNDLKTTTAVQRLAELYKVPRPTPYTSYAFKPSFKNKYTFFKPYKPLIGGGVLSHEHHYVTY